LVLEGDGVSGVGRGSSAWRRRTRKKLLLRLADFKPECLVIACYVSVLYRTDRRDLTCYPRVCRFDLSLLFPPFPPSPRSPPRTASFELAGWARSITDPARSLSKHHRTSPVLLSSHHFERRTNFCPCRQQRWRGYRCAEAARNSYHNLSQRK
jgi:hypothetical protein